MSQSNVNSSDAPPALAEPAARVEPAPSAKTGKRERGDDDALQLMKRMHSQGLDSCAIAHVLDIPVAEVSAALAKRRCVHTSTSSSEQAALVRRFSEDPSEFMCPVLHSLMTDPVVAEDGHTYEREAIEAALRLRSRSPITNTPIGDVVIPNRLLKSQIISYQERYITEVIDTAPHLPPKDAVAAVARAEEFARAHSGASEQLVKLLRFRLQLQTDDRERVIKELVTVLMQCGSATHEILDHFDVWGIAALLENFEEEILDGLFRAALEQARPSTMCTSLGRSLAHCVAHRMCAQAVHLDLRAWQSLQDIAQKLNELDEPGGPAWADGLAVAQIGLSLGCVADFASVQTSTLERAIALLASPSQLAAVAEDIFGAPVLPNTPRPELLARMRLELAARRGEDEGGMLALLVPQDVTDQRAATANLQLAALLSDGLLPGAAPDRAFLSALLCGQGDLGPQELLQKLQAEPSALMRVAASALTALKVQLEVAGHQSTIAAAVDSVKSWFSVGAMGPLRPSLNHRTAMMNSPTATVVNNLMVVHERKDSENAVTCMCFGQERAHKAYVLLATAYKDGMAIVYRCYRTEMELRMVSDADIPGNDIDFLQRNSEFSVHSRLIGHSHACTSIFFNAPEDHLITASIDKSVRIWDVDSGELLKVFTDKSPICLAMFLPRHPQLFMLANKHCILRLTDERNGTVLQRLKLQTEVRALEVDDTGLLVFAGTRNGTIHVLEVSEVGSSVALQLKFSVPVASGCMTCMTFVPTLHGQQPCLLVSVTNCGVSIVDLDYSPITKVLSSLSVRHRVKTAHTIFPLKCCYSPTAPGYLISGSEDEDIYICSLAKGTNYHVEYLKHHKAPVVAVAVNHQATILATSDCFGRVALWRGIDFSHTLDTGGESH